MLWKLGTLSILLGLLQSTQSLQCYVCNSVTHPNCGLSSPHKEYIVTCSDDTAQPSPELTRAPVPSNPSSSLGRNYTFCRKNVAQIPEQPNGYIVRPAETRVLRSCGWVGTSDNTCKWGARDGIHHEMCTCTEDACNTGPALGPVSPAAAASFTYAIFTLVSRTIL